MDLIFLLIIAVLFTLFNYGIAQGDLFNPGVIFCGVHLATILTCLFFGGDYGVSYNINTFLVMGLGLSAFTLANGLAQLHYQRDKSRSSMPVAMRPVNIHVSGIFMSIVIVFQLVVIILTLLYVIRVGREFYGGGSISDSIGKYRLAIVRHGDELADLQIHRSIIVRIGKLACTTLTYPILAIWVNNVLVKKKLDFLLSVSVCLQILYSFVTGTRSGAFRIITAGIFFWIITNRKLHGTIRRGNAKLLFGLSSLSIFLCIGFITVRDLIGRIYTPTEKWYHTLIPYLGGPLINLNTALESPIEKSSLFGQYTCVHLYNELANRLGIERFSTHDINIFLTHNGIHTGNVCTMYYAFICDFGLWGVFPLTFFCGIVYCFLYAKIFNIHEAKSPLNVKFFFYGYMLNSLIMSMFSNRFYENMASIFTVEALIAMSALWFFMKKYILSYEPYTTS